MSHSSDPHTSSDAAATVSVAKKNRLYVAIADILKFEALTPAEVTEEYQSWRDIFDGPEADLQEIRRRMTEMQHDLDRIEPIQVGTTVTGRPQYQTRRGQRVMRLVGAQQAIRWDIEVPGVSA